MIKNNLVQAIIGIAILFIIHFGLNNMLSYSITNKLLLSVHGLLGVMLLLIVLMLNTVQKQLPEKLGMAFLAAVTFKMLIAAMFIYLLIKGKVFFLQNI